MLADAVRSRPADPPPPPPPPAPPPPAPPARHVEHKVQRGETLTEVSARYRTTPEQVQRSNPDIRDPDQLAVGQTVRVPIGEGYGVEPVEREVKPGETLADLAAQYRQPAALLATANRHHTGPTEPLVVGQKVWIPGTRTPEMAITGATPTPLEARVQDTDAAAQRVAEAQRQYDDMNMSTQGRGAALPWLSENLSTTRKGLDAAVKAEIDQRAGPAATEVEWQAAAQAVPQRYAGESATLPLVQEAVANVSRTRAADTVVATARAAGGPEQALQSLNEQLKAAAPDVRAAVLAHDGTKGITEAAGAWAVEALAPRPADPYDPYAAQTHGRAAIARLDGLTKSLDPALAGPVVQAATTGIEQFVERHGMQVDGGPFDADDAAKLITVLGRTADAPGGAQAIDRIAKLNVGNYAAIRSALSEGANPAYAIALARQQGPDNAMTMAAIESGIGGFRDTMQRHADDYAKHMEEISWLVKNHGGSMTPEQLDRAVGQYQDAKGPAWKDQMNALHQRMADDGAALAEQMMALQSLPPDLASHQSALDRQFEETLATQPAQMALTAALQSRPDLVSGARSERLFEFLNTTPLATSAKVGDQIRKWGMEAANAHVKNTVVDAIGPHYDPRNPASVQRVNQALDSLRSNTEWAKTYGLKGNALDKVVDALKQTVPAPGETTEQLDARMKKLDTALDEVKGFDKSTSRGQVLRGLGVALGGLGLLASLDKAQMDPTAKNVLKVAIDGVGLGQKGMELYAGLTQADGDSLVGKLGGSFASKLLGVLSAGIDFWSAGEAIAKGDGVSGALYTTGAVGGLMAAFGAGSMAGPIGIGLVLVSAVGIYAWNSTKEANKHEPGNDDGTSLRFLANAGFNEDTARELVDQSGDGHSVVPLLEAYAQAQGMDLADPAQRARYVQWVNDIPTDRLAVLRDNLHQTMDEFDGDASRFKASDPQDTYIVPDIQQRPHFAASGVAQPETAAQLNAVLSVLGVPALG